MVQRSRPARRRKDRHQSFAYGLRIFSADRWGADHDQRGSVGISGNTWYPIGKYKAPRDRAGRKHRSKARSWRTEHDLKPRGSKTRKLQNPYVTLKRRTHAESWSSGEEASLIRNGHTARPHQRDRNLRLAVTCWSASGVRRRHRGRRAIATETRAAASMIWTPRKTLLEQSCPRCGVQAARSRELAAASGPCRELAAASRPSTCDRFAIVP